MRNLLFAITIIIAASVGLLPASPALAEKRVALVIGNAAYKHTAPLSNTLNDANAISSLLTKAGFDVVESRDDLGVVDFKRALRDFVHTAMDADIAVVYYAGHGIEVRGTNYLIPVDARLASDYDAEDEAVTLDRIMLAVEPVKQLRLIILDACRDNPFMRKMQRTIATRALSGGLAPVEPTTGNTLVAFAAKAGSTSYDGAGPNSPFTTALIKHIAEPGLDIRIALGRVRDEVTKSTGNRQEPFIYGSLGGSTIALVPAPKVADGRTNASQMRIDYEIAERVGNRSAWEAFLATYQSGFYANLARAQLAKLGQAPATGPAPAEPITMASRTPGDGSTGAQEPNSGDADKPQQEARLDFSLRPSDGPENAPAKSGPEVAVDPCKRDGERLARLRAKPEPDKVIALERELGCPRLKPQVIRLRESVIGALPANGPVPAAKPDARGAPAESAAVPAAKPLSEPPTVPEAAPAAPGDSCKRERDRLNELRARPDADAVLRFERELGCERLRAQVQRLKESLAIK
ncbi:MAG: caspase family protein [Xanthobacteraceae bacterium]